MDAEVDSMELVLPEAGAGVVRPSHQVPGRVRRIARAEPPGGVRVARDVDVDGNAERVAAEGEVLRVAVERRRGEIVEPVQAPGDEIEGAVEELDAERELDEPGGLAAVDLLHGV